MIGSLRPEDEAANQILRSGNKCETGPTQCRMERQREGVSKAKTNRSDGETLSCTIFSSAKFQIQKANLLGQRIENTKEVQTQIGNQSPHLQYEYITVLATILDLDLASTKDSLTDSLPLLRVLLLRSVNLLCP